MALSPAPVRAASRRIGLVQLRRRLVTAVLACMVAALSWTGMTISVPAPAATSDSPAGPPSSAELLSTMHAGR